MNHRDKRAGSRHRFVSRVELREVLGKRAMDEQRLPELIEEVLVDSLYYLRHPFTQVLFPMTLRRGSPLCNQDRLLGERQATGQEWQFLKRTMRAKCKAFGTTMEVEEKAGTISVK